MKFVLAGNGMQQVSKIPSLGDIGDKIESGINDTIQHYVFDKIEGLLVNLGDWITNHGIEFAQQVTLLVGISALFLAVLRTGKGAGFAVKILGVSAALIIIESRLQM